MSHRFITAHSLDCSLRVDESHMTGESDDVPKGTYALLLSGSKGEWLWAAVGVQRRGVSHACNKRLGRWIYCQIRKVSPIPVCCTHDRPTPPSRPTHAAISSPYPTNATMVQEQVQLPCLSPYPLMFPTPRTADAELATTDPTETVVDRVLYILACLLVRHPTPLARPFALLPCSARGQRPSADSGRGAQLAAREDQRPAAG